MDLINYFEFGHSGKVLNNEASDKKMGKPTNVTGHHLLHLIYVTVAN